MRPNLGDGSIEAHFRIACVAAILFFLADYAAEALVAFKLTPVKIGGDLAKQMFLSISGAVFGMWRGMHPATEQKEPQP